MLSSASFTLEQQKNDNENKTKDKPNKPKDTNFYQQRLRAWEPIHTAKSVIPTLVVIAAYCIIIGVVLLLASEDMVEFSVDYTHCNSSTSNITCKDLRTNGSDVDSMLTECKCAIQLDVTKEMPGPIKVYYGLTNFYQNHKFYLKSRDDEQLNGKKRDDGTASECKPYHQGENGAPIAPCGAIANSYFNDSFVFENIKVNQTGIAWPTDSGTKFKNPPPQDDIVKAFENYTQPPFWNKRVEELDPNNIGNNGYLNEPFEAWMRAAAFSTFRKAYGILEIDKLEVGVYNVNVDYNFPTTSYEGTKRLIITTTKWIGFKNNFLGIAHIVVGCIIAVFCAVLLFVQIHTKL